jgi:VIT1/CCC1 family predicted Fe2+/Mn2+ transporter
MARSHHHKESHRSGRTNWLRAAVLGSNDAIVSTAGLMIGVTASQAPKEAILVAGVAGMVAGALSMAAGEYVSVSSQSDAERADIEKEKHELEHSPEMELQELTAIYHKRGLTKELATEVARQLTAHDPLGAHLRDELGIEAVSKANPWQAAWVSAVSFVAFALLPIAFLFIAPEAHRLPVLIAASLTSLLILGALGAHLSGAPRLKATLRVVLGGAFAMLTSAAIGKLLGVAIS